MKQISWDGYLFTQPDSAFYFAQLQYDFAHKKGKKKDMANALHTQGASFYLQGDYANAIAYYTQSLKIRKEIEDKQGIASSLNNIAMIYQKQGDHANAIAYYMQCLKIDEESGDKQSIATSLNNIGVIYRKQGDYTEAIEYYTQSLKIKEELGDEAGIASSLNNIGVVYYNQGDYAKAIEYYTQSLKIKEKLGDEAGISGSLNNIGVVYDDQGDRAKAIEYHTQSLKIKEKLGDKVGIAASLNNIGSMYNDQGDYAKAIEYSTRALSIAQEIGIVTETKDASQVLWRAYRATGRYKEALRMHELFIESRDSINSEENQKEIVHQEYKYAYEKQVAKDSVVNAEAKKVKEAQLTAEQAQNKQYQLEAKQQRQQSYILYGGLALALLSGGFIFNRLKVTRKQKTVIESAHEELEEKNTEILDSINYAKRIQSAILPPTKEVKKYLQESFILYKPKDIVAGDFYWLEHQDGKVLFAAADCTGHGVPGAMVSVVCNNGLNRSVREYGLTDPGQILDKTREIVIQEFEKSEEEVKDGMDIALCSLSFSVPSSSLNKNEATEEKQGTENQEQRTAAVLQYAGAHNPLWIIRTSPNGRQDGEVLETKADKQPIGKFDKQLPYTTHSFDLQEGDTIYIFSDGYVDQFGGDKGKKFKSKAFRELLLSIQDKPMEEQRGLIDKAFEAWRGDLEQIDDVCVIGVRV